MCRFWHHTEQQHIQDYREFESDEDQVSCGLRTKDVLHSPHHSPAAAAVRSPHVAGSPVLAGMVLWSSAEREGIADCLQTAV